MKYKILIAEDEINISNILKLYLESGGYEVVVANDGESAYRILQESEIDLAIFDIMMPKIDGLTLTQKVRENSHIPILLLTARIEDNDKILGLNLGADDYLTKPFNPLEVVARVNAHLRRNHTLNKYFNTLPSSVLTIGSLMLDMEKYRVKNGNRDIVLTPTEYKLLALMMKNPNRVYTKAQLCEAINGEFYENYENAITVHISNLRDKIEDDPKKPIFIKNVRGVGYKIEKSE